MQAKAMAAYTRSILEPLVQLVAEQEATIRPQAETIGRQAANLERAVSTVVAIGGELEALKTSQSPVTTQQPPQPATVVPKDSRAPLAPHVAAGARPAVRGAVPRAAGVAEVNCDFMQEDV